MPLSSTTSTHSRLDHRQVVDCWEVVLSHRRAGRRARCSDAARPRPWLWQYDCRMVPFEASNSEAYLLLLRIEVALRELIKQEMERVHGTRWTKQIPGELRKKVREAQSDEEGRKQFGYLALGPLYYLTFGELLELLKRAQAKPAASRLGQGFLNTLDTLITPRNAVSHGRPVSEAGLEAVRAVYHQLELALSHQGGLDSLLERPDTGIYPTDAPPRLLGWLRSCKATVVSLEAEVPNPAPFLEASRQYWWGLSDSCPFDCHPIENAATLMEHYALLPVGLGSKADRQQFVEKNEVAKAIENAIVVLEVQP